MLAMPFIDFLHVRCVASQGSSTARPGLPAARGRMRRSRPPRARQIPTGNENLRSRNPAASASSASRSGLKMVQR